MTNTVESAILLIAMSISFSLLALAIITLVSISKRKQLYYLKKIDAIGIETKESACNYISREIHDNILHKLTSSLEILRILDSKDSKNKKLLAHSIEILSQTSICLDNISDMLYKNKISHRSLIDLVKTEIEIFRYLNLNVAFDLIGNASPINVKKEKEIISILQESFRNIIEHSKAKNIKLIMVYDLFQLDLYINDDGIGFDSTIIENDLTGKGLRNMKFRAKELEGTISISSFPDSGTNIHLQIPINHE